MPLRGRNDWLAAPRIAAIEGSVGVMLTGAAAVDEARRMASIGGTPGACIPVFGVFALATIAYVWRNERRWRAGLCLGCGYSLAGLTFRAVRSAADRSGRRSSSARRSVVGLGQRRVLRLRVDAQLLHRRVQLLAVELAAL